MHCGLAGDQICSLARPQCTSFNGWRLQLMGICEKVYGSLHAHAKYCARRSEHAHYWRELLKRTVQKSPIRAYIKEVVASVAL